MCSVVGLTSIDNFGEVTVMRPSPWIPTSSRTHSHQIIPKDNLSEFALMHFRGHVPSVTIFRSFITDNLIDRIWQRATEDNSIVYNDGLNFNRGEFSRRLILISFAVYIRIVGLQKTYDRWRPKAQASYY